MRIVSVDELTHPVRTGLTARSEKSTPCFLNEDASQVIPLYDQGAYFLEKVALGSRVLILEGISGSGKDTLQEYLKDKLKGRDVYDYSEGEVLHSWKQLQIDGIFRLRIQFMKLFLKYLKDTINRERNAVFLLNRFHLSAYVMTIIPQPKLQREYDEIINILRTLPVHIFILRLSKGEIESRTLHSERSGAWRRFQQQIVQKEGFRDRVARYSWQQELMLETAQRQQIPYSVIRLSRLPSAPKAKSASFLGLGSSSWTGANTAGTKVVRRKRSVPQPV